MKANHARPMLAFWLLALVAALITALGLRADVRHVTVPSGAPEPVQSGGAPELVLGGLLRGQPATATITSPLLVAPAPPSVGGSRAAATATASTSIAVRRRDHADSRPAAKPISTSQTSTSTAGSTGHGKGRKKGADKVRTTARSSATRLEATVVHGSGHGKAKGHRAR